MGLGRENAGASGFSSLHGKSVSGLILQYSESWALFFTRLLDALSSAPRSGFASAGEERDSHLQRCEDWFPTSPLVAVSAFVGCERCCALRSI